ncbi:MAG: hypothetical protein ACP5HK_00590, partial [Acidilobus sp.]
PLVLLRPEEGVVFGRCEGLEAFRELMIGKPSCRRSSILYSTQICEGTSGTVVIKDYSYAFPKWLLAGILSFGAYPFRQTAAGRATNEFASLVSLRGIVRTPSVLALCVSPTGAAMMREFVDGDVIMRSSDPGAWRLAGRVLARIHRGGFSLGDPNPGNLVQAKCEAWLIDAEQATKFSPQRGAWDLAVYYYYARFFGAPQDLVEESVRGYVKEAGELWHRVRPELLSPRVAPFLVSLPPYLAEMLEVVNRVTDNERTP